MPLDITSSPGGWRPLLCSASHSSPMTLFTRSPTWKPVQSKYQRVGGALKTQGAL